jgi:hypothetical protein
MTASDLHRTTDAYVWADEFCRIVGERIPAIAGEREWMMAWFANAIMVGYDHGVRAGIERGKEEALGPPVHA